MGNGDRSSWKWRFDNASCSRARLSVTRLHLAGPCVFHAATRPLFPSCSHASGFETKSISLNKTLAEQQRCGAMLIGDRSPPASPTLLLYVFLGAFGQSMCRPSTERTVVPTHLAHWSFQRDGGPLQWWHFLSAVAFRAHKPQEVTVCGQKCSHGHEMEALKHPVPDCREKKWCSRIQPRSATHVSVVDVQEVGKRRGECCRQTDPAPFCTMKEAQRVLWESGTRVFSISSRGNRCCRAVKRTHAFKRIEKCSARSRKRARNTLY